MALDKTILEKGINALQSPNYPKNTADAAGKWSQFIVNYALGGKAGSATPQFVGYPAILKASFVASMTSGVFLETLGTNIQPMWMAALWTGTGVTGVTTAALGLTLDSRFKLLSPKLSSQGADSAKIIADEIDSWSKSILVTLTNTTSGVSVPSIVT